MATMMAMTTMMLGPTGAVNELCKISRGTGVLEGCVWKLDWGKRGLLAIKDESAQYAPLKCPLRSWFYNFLF